ncbi:MAG: histidine kinase [Rikenellaceae bacterium]|nr:histidine kinase [Rikenellaceae bacterium]
MNIIAYIIVIVWPILQGMNEGDSLRDITSKHFATYIGLPVMFILLFYFDYYYLFDKLWKRGRRKQLWFLLINLLLIFTIAIGSFYWQNHFRVEFNIGTEPLIFSNTVFYYSVILAMTVGLSITLRYMVDHMREERKMQLQEAEQREAELRNLRAQLNPHFLFNAMNNIYSLISIDASRAQEATHNLSKILRYVLYDEQLQEVPLTKELDFIRSYIDIMKLRLTSNVQLTANVTQDTNGIMVAPLMFISLIENAFKHGVSYTEPSYIDIDISVAEEEGQRVVACQVSNSYYPKTDTDRSGSGIGVQNLRRRLELLYPNHHKLSMEFDGKVFHSLLKLYI